MNNSLQQHDPSASGNPSEAPQGILLVDKPQGWTSHDVVAKVRTYLPRKTKVGHTGTLDPFATGLLVILVGKQYTKLSQALTGLDKTYNATIQWCQTSTTHDPEGDITPTPDCSPPSKEEVQAALQSLIGPQQQIPPMHSAIKVRGKKLYELARKGTTIPREPRSIVIHDAKLVEHAHTTSAIEVSVSSGTYIRAIARDLGEQLECGAFLQQLHRTDVGPWSITQATTNLEKDTILGGISDNDPNIAKFRNSGIVDTHS